MALATLICKRVECACMVRQKHGVSHPHYLGSRIACFASAPIASADVVVSEATLLTQWVFNTPLDERDLAEELESVLFDTSVLLSLNSLKMVAADGNARPRLFELPLGSSNLDVVTLVATLLMRCGRASLITPRGLEVESQ